MKENELIFASWLNYIIGSGVSVYLVAAGYQPTTVFLSAVLAVTAVSLFRYAFEKRA